MEPEDDPEGKQREKDGERCWGRRAKGKTNPFDAGTTAAAVKPKTKAAGTTNSSPLRGFIFLNQ